MVGKSTLRRMRAPPIVGVPLLILCDSGPSERTTWPICFFWSSRMNHGASTNDRSIALTVAAMTLKGTYRRTLRKPSQSASWRSGYRSS